MGSFIARCIMINTMDKFAEWVNSEVERRGWSFRETARRAGLSATAVSQVVGGQANPGLDFCIGLARALKIPPEQVLRRAGLLPPRAEGDELLDTLLHYYDLLSRGDQQRLLAIARSLAEEKIEYDGQPAGASAATT